MRLEQNWHKIEENHLHQIVCELFKCFVSFFFIINLLAYGEIKFLIQF